MKRNRSVFLYPFISLLFLSGCDETVKDARQEAAQPLIYPDYAGVTIPANIAPLNFSMADETALLVDAVITDRHGNELHSQDEESEAMAAYSHSQGVRFQERLSLFETHNCIIHTTQERKVVVQGLDGYIVAENDDTLLICKLSEEQRIKQFQALAP